ncbi:hypothetical protein GQ457_12G016230 [Hibiscus cannabinus]
MNLFQRLRRCSNRLPCKEDILVTTQDNQLFGLRDKPITQQNALPKSEGPPRYLPGQDPLSLLRHPLCHPTYVDYRSTRIDEVETSTVNPDAITI